MEPNIPNRGCVCNGLMSKELGMPEQGMKIGITPFHPAIFTRL
jgi:hypothetical protein